MSIRRRVLLVTGSLIGIGVAILESTPAGRRLWRLAAHQVARTARYQGGRFEGFRYRLARRHPDPDVSDGVLADRIRSTLGPLEHRLDIPRIHVLACGHDVMLHGDVDDARHARELVAAVAAVPGVACVDSHLKVGLIRGDSRPSEGGGRH